MIAAGWSFLRLMPHSGRSCGAACGKDLSCCGAPAALEGAVDRRAADPEQVGDLGRAVLSGGAQADQMSLLPCVELGPAAAQAALGLRNPHPLLSPLGYLHGLRLHMASDMG
jgi:hypothetical protein